MGKAGGELGKEAVERFLFFVIPGQSFAKTRNWQLEPSPPWQVSYLDMPSGGSELVGFERLLVRFQKLPEGAAFQAVQEQIDVPGVVEGTIGEMA